MTGFSNSEEKSIGMDQKVPFLLEDKLKELGAKYEKVLLSSLYAQLDWYLHAMSMKSRPISTIGKISTQHGHCAGQGLVSVCGQGW